MCARHAGGARGAVVGGSSWSAPGRAALLEPPAAAAAAAAAHCAGSSPLRGSGGDTPPAGVMISFLGGRWRGSRADRCGAARHIPGRSREEHHHSLLTVLEQCRRTRSLGAARPPARPDGGKATGGTRLAQPRGSWPRTRLWGGAGRQKASRCWVVGVSYGPWGSQGHQRPACPRRAETAGRDVGRRPLQVAALRRQVQPRGPDGPLSATRACPRARSGARCTQ